MKRIFGVLLILTVVLSIYQPTVVEAESVDLGWKKISSSIDTSNNSNTQIEKYRYYTDEDTYYIGTWKKIGGKDYYFDDFGYINTGWRTIDGKDYLFNKSGALAADYGWIRLEGFNDSDNVWAYANSKNNYKKSEWLKDNGKWYYFNEQSESVSGSYYKIGNKEYLFDQSGALAYDKWVNVSAKYGHANWYRSDSSGLVIKNQWKKINNYWYWFDEYGSMADMDALINGKLYSFDKSGKMNSGTGWAKSNGYVIEKQWRYLINDVAVVNQWKKINSKWYHFNEEGMLTNSYGYEEEHGRNIPDITKVNDEESMEKRSYRTVHVRVEPKIIEGKKYIFDHNGAMVSNGWIRVRALDIDTWAYYKDGKFIKNDWLRINGEWYYFNYLGQMEKSKVIDDNNELYAVDESGKLIKNNGWYQGLDNYNIPKWLYINSNGKPSYDQWTKISNKWYYFNNSGHILQSAYHIDNKGKIYNFRSNGMLTSNQWVKSDSRNYVSGWSYGDVNGVVHNGWINVKGKDYFQDGFYPVSIVGNNLINGKLYQFDSSGALIK